MILTKFQNFYQIWEFEKLQNLDNNTEFLASQDALEVMLFTYWVSEWVRHLLMVSIDLTDVTLVSDDT